MTGPQTQKQSTIALSSGEAELVAALSGACEGMGLRQQAELVAKVWKQCRGDVLTSQKIQCCDSSAGVSMVKRKGSTRKTRHIELKAFFLQQLCARPEVRLVQVRTDEIFADTV